MIPNNRKRPAPMLMGVPSPSLARINKMNMADLEERIERLAVERQRLQEKIERLQAITPPPGDRIDELGDQIKRLAVLQRTAKDRLATKGERKTEWEDRQQSRQQ